MALKRKPPNVLITGTPGTGKTTMCEAVAERTCLKHVNISELVKAEQLHEGWDPEHEAYILDEDKVVDALEDMIEDGGVLVEYHSCDFFPERWFDLVIVLQTDNTILYERLQNRNYPQKKISENVTCEIMNVVVEEARESFREEIVHVLQSNTVEDIDSNVDRTCLWFEQHTASFS
eukprot:jgi/Botrbrau1/378/Bobra.110_2s0033.1